MDSPSQIEEFDSENEAIPLCGLPSEKVNLTPAGRLSPLGCMKCNDNDD